MNNNNFPADDGQLSGSVEDHSLDPEDSVLEDSAINSLSLSNRSSSMEMPAGCSLHRASILDSTGDDQGSGAQLMSQTADRHATSAQYGTRDSTISDEEQSFAESGFAEPDGATAASSTEDLFLRSVDPSDLPCIPTTPDRGEAAGVTELFPPPTPYPIPVSSSMGPMSSEFSTCRPTTSDPALEHDLPRPGTTLSTERSQIINRLGIEVRCPQQAEDDGGHSVHHHTHHHHETYITNVYNSDTHHHYYYGSDEQQPRDAPPAYTPSDNLQPTRPPIQLPASVSRGRYPAEPVGQPTSRSDNCARLPSSNSDENEDEFDYCSGGSLL
jgi:hypothetical protein